MVESDGNMTKWQKYYVMTRFHRAQCASWCFANNRAMVKRNKQKYYHVIYIYIVTYNYNCFIECLQTNFEKQKGK